MQVRFLLKNYTLLSFNKGCKKLYFIHFKLRFYIYKKTFITEDKFIIFFSLNDREFFALFKLSKSVFVRMDYFQIEKNII